MENLIPELSFKDIERGDSFSIDQLKNALSNHGFFSITDHGLSKTLVDDCYKLITYDTYGDGWNGNGTFGVTSGKWYWEAKMADTVLLCPIYTANEKLRLNFTYHSFAKLIIKNSNIKLVQVDDELQLQRFIKQNTFGEKIYIGMGAGSISNWMKNLKNIF